MRGHHDGFVRRALEGANEIGEFRAADRPLDILVADATRFCEQLANRNRALRIQWTDSVEALLQYTAVHLSEPDGLRKQRGRSRKNPENRASHALKRMSSPCGTSA